MFFELKAGRYVLDRSRSPRPSEAWLRQQAKNLLTPEVRMGIKMKADFTCTYCLRKGGLMLDPDGRRWHMDHIEPLHRRKRIGVENVALSCAYCNISKGSRTPEEWKP